MASVADIRTYVYGATYDSWNRVQTMTYPDGEVVTYHYNAAGQVESLTSNKQGRQSVIVDRIGYDKEGHTGFAAYQPVHPNDHVNHAQSTNDAFPTAISHNTHMAAASQKNAPFSLP